MSLVAITGANGFLGWHTKCAAFSYGLNSKSIPLGINFSLQTTIKILEQANLVIHLAGVNRGSDAEIQQGNIQFAQQLSEALFLCKHPPQSLIFANSIQANNGSIYGEAKKSASEILEITCNKLNIDFVNVHIPNVFGEHCRPFYNSVTATFCHLISKNQNPEVLINKELTMVHAQDVADYLFGKISTEIFESLFWRLDVIDLMKEIQNLSDHYSRGVIPDISNKFNKNLFNTYRSYLSHDRFSFHHEKHSDKRGSFFEIVKVFGGQGQTSFSTTLPGISRGDHFHRRKIERFTVLSGEAKIEMRKMFSSEIMTFQVSGDEPISIDMPTLWTHNITNIGDSNLLTSFWISEVFEANNPDTYFEKV